MLEQLRIYRMRILRLEQLTGIRISVKISQEDDNLRKNTKIVETWYNGKDERFHRIEFKIKDLKNVNRMLYDKIRYQELKNKDYEN